MTASAAAPRCSPGLAIFGVASVWAAWSGSAGELIAARAAMGIGGALIMPSTLSVLTNSFTDPKERAKAIGIWAAVSGPRDRPRPHPGWLAARATSGGGRSSWSTSRSAMIAHRRRLLAGPRVAGPRGAADRRRRRGALDRRAVHLGLVDHRGAHARLDVDLGARPGSRRPPSSWACSSGTSPGSTEPMLNLGYFADRRFAAGCVSVTLLFFALFGTIFFLTPVPAVRPRVLRARGRQGPDPGGHHGHRRALGHQAVRAPR